jgi:hypothetical protein
VLAQLAGTNLSPKISLSSNPTLRQFPIPFFGIGFFPSAALFLAECTVTSIKSPPLSFRNRFTLFRGFLDALFFAISISTV